MYQPNWKIPEQKPKKPQQAQPAKEPKMASKFGTRWQKVRQHRLLRIGIIATLIALAAFILAVWMFGWDWTGFNGGYSQITTTSISHGTTTATVKPPGITLWDLLQLLIIPGVLTVGGLWFNQIQKDREQRATEQRVKTERDTAEQRAKTEREIAEDNQRETALQGYIDKMSELLLEKKLRESAKDAEVRNIARVRTLTALRRLDAERKGSVLQFLYESGLIDKEMPIVELYGANLEDADLSNAQLGEAKLRRVNLNRANLYSIDLEGANLYEADLSGADLYAANLQDADLRYAKLHEAILEGACLWNANLEGADLSKANLIETSLSGANLSGVDLQEADLREAFLEKANLSGARLKGAKVSIAKLATAHSLKNATMPDGSTHP
jgi:uncharacterized protein YjbI with pentapeptide repeats